MALPSWFEVADGPLSDPLNLLIAMESDEDEYNEVWDERLSAQLQVQMMEMLSSTDHELRVALSDEDKALRNLCAE